MINNISEATVRVASKIDPSGAIHEREVNQQEAKAMSEARPVEKSEESNPSEADNSQNKKGSTQYSVDDDRLVFEKYNKKGDLVLRLPPSKTPVDQKA